MPKLQGQVALVSGGSGIVGSGIIYMFLAEGATVIAPVRSQEAANRLLADVAGVAAGRLQTPQVDVSDEQALAGLVQAVRQQHTCLHHCVSCLGSWSQKGCLSDVSRMEFEAELARATWHWLFAKHTLPLLANDPSSSFTFISGLAGERVFRLNAALITVANAALYGVVLAYQAEFANKAPRVCEMRIGSVIRRHGDAGNAKHDSTLAHFSHRAIGKLVVDEVATTQVEGQVLRVTDKELHAVQC